MSTLRFNTWQNTGGTEVANSTLGTGKILQVVTATTTAQESTTSTTHVATALSVSITPTSSSSKILVFFTTPRFGASTSANAYLTLFRDGVDLAVSQGFVVLNTGASVSAPANFFVEDSPATTSSVTYNIRFSTSAGTVYIYRSNNGGSLTAMEVAA